MRAEEAAAAREINDTWRDAATRWAGLQYLKRSGNADVRVWVNDGLVEPDEA